MSTYDKRNELAQDIWDLGDRSEVTLNKNILTIKIELTEEERKRVIERDADGASAIDVRLDGGPADPVLPLWLTPVRRPAKEQPWNIEEHLPAKVWYAILSKPTRDGQVLIRRYTWMPLSAQHMAMAIVLITKEGEFKHAKPVVGELRYAELSAALMSLAQAEYKGDLPNAQKALDEVLRLRTEEIAKMSKNDGGSL